MRVPYTFFVTREWLYLLFRDSRLRILFFRDSWFFVQIYFYVPVISIFYFFVICESCIYLFDLFVIRETNVSACFFRECEAIFRLSRDAWKGQKLLSESVFTRGIGDPLNHEDLGLEWNGTYLALEYTRMDS